MPIEPQPSKILKLYNRAVENVPLLRYSWIIVATICILALIAYFKLQNATVFIYAIAVIFISFLGFIFSLFLKRDELYIKILRYFLVTCISFTVGIAIIGFGTFIIWEQPEFYKRWFPDNRLTPTDTSNNGRDHDSTRTNVFTPPEPAHHASVKKKSPIAKVLSIQLSSKSAGFLKIYVGVVEVNVLAESTTFNPRIDVSPFAPLTQIMIITRSGDSCFTTVPKVVDSSTYRIVPTVNNII